MILKPASYSIVPTTAWAAGLALACLGIGIQGAISPVLPVLAQTTATVPAPEEVAIEEFNPPPAAPDASEPPEAPDTTEPEQEEDSFELPTLPPIAPPITPPEMVELAQLEPFIEPAPKPMVEEKPTQPKPEPKPTPKPKPQPKATASSKPKASSSGQRSVGSTPGAAPAMMAGTGTSSRKLLRSPKPFYPSAAIRAGQQGTVRLLVIVEADGQPSAVSVASSCGFPDLDASARDTVQRRWRWSPGQSFRTYLPIKFDIRR